MDRFSDMHSDMDGANRKRSLTESELAARKKNICPARDGRQQWIMLANSRRQKFIEDYYKGTAVSEESYPYKYLYVLKQEPILAFFLFTVEILNLKGCICILEREKEYLKPLRFKILNPEGCRGSFDIIFSMKSEESEGDPDNGQNEQSAPTYSPTVAHSG